MRTARAVLIVVGLVVLIGTAGSASVRAAAPELGASIQSVVYVTEDRTLALWNRSTTEAAFTLTPTGGWALDRDNLILAPDEHATVRIVGTGDDGASISVHVIATAPTPVGAQQSELVLTSQVFQQRPFDLASLIVPVLFVVVAIVAALLVLRRLRPWELRVARAR